MFLSSKYIDVNPELFTIGAIEYKNLEDLYQLLLEERFSKQPLFQVSVRDFAHEDAKDNFKTDHELRIRNLIKQWEKSKLILKRKGKGWQKHSFTELVWFRLIMKYREFGFPLNRISNVYQKLMLPAINYGLRHKIALEIAGQKIDNNQSDKFEVGAMPLIYPGTFWTDDRITSFNSEIKKVEKTIPLTDIIVNALAFGFPIFIITDGLNVEDVILHEDLAEENSILFENHISINLTEVVSEFVKGDLDQIFKFTLEKLSPQEKEVLNLIRTSQARRIIFEYDSTQNLSLIIEETTQTPTRLEKQFLEEVFKKKKYERIIADSNEGELVQFIRHNKTKIKKEES